MCLKAGNYVRAKDLFGKSKGFFAEFKKTSDGVTFNHVDYNLGSVFMAEKEHALAAESYLSVLQSSLFNKVATCEQVSQDKKLHFNS